MDEKEKQEFSLEDIMKEFGSEPEEETPETAEEPQEEPIPEAEGKPAVTSDTVRLDNLSGDTIHHTGFSCGYCSGIYR